MGKFDLKKAKAFLNAIKTPEQAIKLAGKERAQYLKALDTVYGPADKRAADMGFNKRDWYHGTDANFDTFDADKLGNRTTGITRKLGHHFSANPEVAATYAADDIGGNIMPVKLRTKGGTAYYPEGGSLSPEDANLAREQIIKSNGRPVIFRDAEDSIGKGITGDVAIVPLETDIRSKFAAFDPRFKDSAKLMAGAAPLAGFNPLQEGVAGFDVAMEQMDKAKRGLLEPIAERLDVRANPQQPSAKEDMVNIMSTAADFANPLPFAHGGEVNFKHFKKVATHADHSILRHPDGHEIKVAHGKLDDKMRKQLDSLPHYAEGGDVLDLSNAANNVSSALSKGMEAQDAYWQESQRQSDINQMADLAGQPMPFGGAQSEQPIAAPAIPESNVNLGQPQQTPQSPVMASKALPKTSLEQGLRGMQQASTEMGKIESDAAAEKEVAAQVRQEEIETMNQKYTATRTALETEAQNIAHDIKNFKIDPNRYWNESGTGGKIANVIGLMLGGLGSGLTKGPNLAAEYINRQIDRDIDAQKAELGKKQNMLSAIYQQMGNLRDSETMLRRVYADHYSAQMEEIAARSNDPMAIQRAKMFNAEKLAQLGPQMDEMARRQTLLKMYQEGKNKPGGSGIQSEQMIEFLPDKLQDQAYKDLDKIRTIDKGMQNVANAMKKMEQLQSTGSRLGSPLQSPEQINALNIEISSLAKELYGKVSDNEIGMLEGLKIKFKDSPETVKTKMDTVMQMMRKNRVSSVLRSQPGLDLMPPEPIVSARPRK